MATAPDVKAKEAPKDVKVLSADGTRVFFVGPEDDARDYVERNFPRPHIQPGVVTDEVVPDAKLSNDATFDGVAWSDEKGS